MTNQSLVSLVPRDKRARLAVIGVGNMGSVHARDAAALPNTELVAVCDLIPERAESVASQFGAKSYTHFQDLLAVESLGTRDKDGLDGVIIATPHYDHTPISIASFERGLHVLTEKPIAVTVSDARAMITAYEHARQSKPSLKFAIMFQMRTFGRWQKVKQMIDDGQLGRLVRATWVITDWFRTQAYYDNGQWRATWQGEGGGVLLNQCPHNLDLYQWFFGMPQKVVGFASIGKYHNIEVEDEVSACFEHPGGMVGHLITSTAESPGTNRLEIVGENGKLVVEDGALTFWRNDHSMLEHLRTSPDAYAPVQHQVLNMPFEHHGQPGHALIIENFANAILRDEPLIVPAPEGIGQIELGNAVMLSSFTGRPVDLPMDAEAYAAELAGRVRNSRFKKVASTAAPADISKSFQS